MMESADAYPHVVVDFGDGTRVIEGRCGIQWIVQRRLRNTRYPWEGVSFCRTKWGLLHYSGHPQDPVLLSLPDDFPVRTAPARAGESDFDAPAVSGPVPTPEIGCPPVPAMPGAVSRSSEASATT